MVINSKNKFLGTITDGDIRRAIIRGANIENKIGPYVKTRSFTIDEEKFKKFSKEKITKISNIFKKSKIDVIPIINKKKKIINFIDTQKNISQNNNLEKLLNDVPLVLMAGGEGTRLKPFTNIFPKPLIPVNNLPAAEHIINFFKKDGVNKIFISVNYKKDLIKSYFRDKVTLRYIEEKET